MCSSVTKNLNSALKIIKYLKILQPIEFKENYGEFNYKLTFLNLTQGNLSTKDIDFRIFKNLKIIDLSRNFIDDFSWKIFGNSSNVFYLNLDKNLIKQINRKMFENFENIFYLSLRENCLKTIFKNSFQYLKNLVYMDLNLNKLKFVGEDLFPKSNQLKTLIYILEEDKFFNLNKKVFQHLNMLKILKTSHKLFCIYAMDFNCPLKNCEWEISMINFYKKSIPYNIIMKIMLWNFSIFSIIILIIQLYARTNNNTEINKIAIFPLINDLIFAVHLIFFSLIFNFENGNIFYFFNRKIKKINFCKISLFFNIFYLNSYYLNNIFQLSSKFFYTKFFSITKNLNKISYFLPIFIIFLSILLSVFLNILFSV